MTTEQFRMLARDAAEGLLCAIGATGRKPSYVGNLTYQAMFDALPGCVPARALPSENSYTLTAKDGFNLTLLSSSESLFLVSFYEANDSIRSVSSERPASQFDGILHLSPCYDPESDPWWPKAELSRMAEAICGSAVSA